MGLSYTQLYDLVRRERSHQELQELAVNFYDEVKELLSEPLPTSSFSAAEAARVQLANTRKLCKGLHELRETKILHLAQSHCKTGATLVDTSKLLPIEQQLYGALVRLLSEQRATLGIEEAIASATQILLETQIIADRPKVDVSSPIVHSLPPVVSPVGVIEIDSKNEAVMPTRITVRVVRAVPAFVGREMETYGPYDENDTVELPSSVAQVLIRKGSAQPND